MNKTEVAAALNVSVRAVERYAAAGKLPSQYIKGLTGKILDFDETDVQRFKTEIETPVARAVLVDDNHRQGMNRQVPPGAEVATIVVAGEPIAIDGQALARALHSLALLAPDNGRQRALSVPIESKLVLTMDEARALSGLSREVLSAAIHAGELAAKKMGRGWKIKRSDLTSYIDKL